MTGPFFRYSVFRQFWFFCWLNYFISHTGMEAWGGENFFGNLYSNNFDFFHCWSNEFISRVFSEKISVSYDFISRTILIFVVDKMISFPTLAWKHGKRRIFFWYYVFRKFWILLVNQVILFPMCLQNFCVWKGLLFLKWNFRGHFKE